jgi:hypothetical protein
VEEEGDFVEEEGIAAVSEVEEEVIHHIEREQSRRALWHNQLVALLFTLEDRILMGMYPTGLGICLESTSFTLYIPIFSWLVSPVPYSSLLLLPHAPLDVSVLLVRQGIRLLASQSLFPE